MQRLVYEVGPSSMEMAFRTESRDGPPGQSNLSLIADVGGAAVGCIDYVVFQGQPSINMIAVPPNLRRNGCGSALVYQLQREYPDQEIHWGMLTDDGAKLFESIPKRFVANPEYAAKHELFEANKAKLAEYERLAGEFDAIENPTDAQRTAYRLVTGDWNDLHDMQWDLEQYLGATAVGTTLLVEVEHADHESGEPAPSITQLDEAFATRVAALPRLQQSAGAAYTLHYVAAKALQGASGDPRAVNWAQVHQDAFDKAVGQDRQPVAKVLEAIKLHSPGAVTPQQIAAVEAMGEPKTMVESPVQQSPISKILRAIANKRWPMDQYLPQDQTQAWAGECGLFNDVAWRVLKTTDIEHSLVGMIAKFSDLECPVSPPSGLTLQEVSDLGIEEHINHCWIVSGGRHYDASCPDGVDGVFELRSIRQAAVEVLQRDHPEVLERLCGHHRWWRDSVDLLGEFIRLREAAGIAVGKQTEGPSP